MKKKDFLGKALDIARDVMDVADVAQAEYERVQNGIKYGQSNQYQEDMIEAKKIMQYEAKRTLYFILLWIAIIIATIILCVIGDDSVLVFLNL